MCVQLVPGISRAEFVVATGEAGWRLLAARGGGADERSFALMFEAAPGVYVSWVELNEMPEQPLIELDGDEPSPALFGEIRSMVAAVEESTLLALSESELDAEATPLLLFALGVAAAAERNPQVARRLEDGLQASSVSVRRGALLGVLYLPWFCGLETLREIESGDESDENRVLARRALARLPG